MKELRLQRDDFEILKVIGRGAFGEVSQRHGARWEGGLHTRAELTRVLPVASGRRGEAEGQWADFCHENAAQVGDAEEGRGQFGARWDFGTLQMGGGEGGCAACGACRACWGKRQAWPLGWPKVHPNSHHPPLLLPYSKPFLEAAVAPIFLTVTLRPGAIKHRLWLTQATSIQAPRLT